MSGRPAITLRSKAPRLVPRGSDGSGDFSAGKNDDAVAAPDQRGGEAEI